MQRSSFYPSLFYKCTVTLIAILFQSISLANEQTSRLVEPNFVNSLTKSESTLIIDSRTSKEYQKGHIPNAINLPILQTFGPNPRADLVKPISQIKALFSHHGINFNKKIIVYDNGKLIDSARLIWILEANGITQVAMLNGGFPHWQKLNLAISDKIITPTKTNFIPAISPERIASKLATRLAIDNNNNVILDARPKIEYEGKMSTAMRKGHIPSAINIPWDESYAIAKDGTFIIKNINELKKIYAEIDKSKKVITYCNKGKQSALTHFVMRELGYNVSAYDGSWFEWGNDLSLPIQVPSL